MADEPTESLPMEHQNTANNEQKENDPSDAKDAESSVDVLGLLAEGVSRDRIDSDEEMDAEAEVDPEDEEMHSPDSACDRESNDAGENIDMNLPGENEDDQNDQDDEIDINEDFSLQFDNEEDTLGTNNALITEIVSLAPIETVSLAPTETSEVSEDAKMEIDPKEDTIESDVPKSSVDESTSKAGKSDTNDVTSSEIDFSNLEKSKLSEDIIKGLREEAQRVAVGDVSREDLENLGKELQNAMKTLFGKTMPESDEILKFDDKRLTLPEVIDSNTSIKDKSEVETESMEIEITKESDEKNLQTSSEPPAKEPDHSIETNISESKVESKVKSSRNVFYVDLDDISSDSEATCVRIPSAIEVISSSTSNNTTVAHTDDTGASVISGLPSTSQNKTSGRLNMAEITISSVSANNENQVDTQMEILNLDSDDEETPQEDNVVENRMDEGNDQNIVNVAPEINATCVNLKCECGSDTPLVPCPIFMLGMYGVRRSRKTVHPKICQQCFDAAVAETEMLMSKFKNGKPLMEVRPPNYEEAVEILDSDSDDEKNDEFIPLPGYDPLTAEELEFVTENLPDVMEEVSRKYKLDDQIQMCNELIYTKAKLLEEDTLNLHQEYKDIERNLCRIRNTLYNTVRISRKYLPELIIPLDHDENEESADPEKMNVEPDPKLLPLTGINKFEPLKVGDSVYTVKHSIFGAWIPATIEEISPIGTPMANGMPLMFSLLSVKFFIGERRLLKNVTGRQVAYPKPCKFLYLIGTRVIALFKDNVTASFKKDSFYSGVIAETPNQFNKYRYLVFFDDGYSQYVYHQNILPVCEKSEKVWEDVHPDSRDFVRKYLTSYPERPMVRLEIGHVLKAEHNGGWCNAVVRDLDSSLALLQYEASHKVEWIYRGSTRLLLLYQQLQAADRRAHGPGRQRTLRTTNHTLRKMNVPYVEYTRTDDKHFKSYENENENEQEEVPENTKIKPLRAVAKKSTSTVIIPKEEDFTPEVMESGNLVRSRVVYYSPKVWIHPKKMVLHECGPSCLNNRSPPLGGLRSYHPLAKPLLSAWERILTKSKYRRAIVYRAPCGKRLRCMEDVHRYLRMTKSDMSVDLFDFDFRVHCLAEFVATSCYVKKADISHGVESMLVPCVNYYDHSLPDFWTYSTSRQPTEGVDLNLDENFLCGCDCTDDCQDKEKCRCWKLTYEGTRFIGLKDENVGYEYKRLYDQVPTGIYECNSRCKCAKTCLNRVVQHPLQLKLQVFKTYNKGWGIRALNDIPRGCFICVYAGNLLTDAAANDGGKKNEGDKYLADLDYIEVVEKLKEGYEFDVPELNKDLDKPKDGSEKEDDDDDDDQENEDVEKTTRAYNRPDSDEEFSPDYSCVAITNNVYRKEIKTRLRARQTQKKNSEGTNVKSSDNLAKKKDNDDSITISDDEEVIREPSRFAAPEGFNDDEYVPRFRSVRSFYGDDEACFIMDARVTGNIGRYLNHSCSPNVFVQNVFVDTHDPRFPWVAFFSLEHIRTGTELTWNYNYDIGSVPGKVIYCKCGADNCRGRLL